MDRIRTTLALAISILALAACATAGGAGETRAVDIQVENTLSPPGTLTIWIVPELDTRQVLGTVPPGEGGTFSYTVGVAGRYQLLAETAAGSDLLSPRFSIPSDTNTVTWNLNTNTVHLD